jgi:phospholipid-binding lipoprotein MlaA
MEIKASDMRGVVSALLLFCAASLPLAGCAGRSPAPEMTAPDDSALAGTKAESAPKSAPGENAPPPSLRPARPPLRDSGGQGGPDMPDTAEGADELDDYSSPPRPLIVDPLEPWNRFWFGFNDLFYAYVVRPVYTGYAFVVPEKLRAGLKNALANALFPVRFVNSLLQGKFKAAGVELGRFVVNSTLGAGGLMDAVAGRKTVTDVDPEGEDFGQTLGVWGMGPGIYLVWPVMGPSNARDTAGRIADWAVDPLLFVPGTITVTAARAGIWGGLRFNAADDALEVYESIKKAAVDPYISLREMYTRHRQSRIER